MASKVSSKTVLTTSNYFAEATMRNYKAAIDVPINKGGHIFFAKLNNEIVGTVALMPKQTTFEVTKMAVSTKHRGFKTGQQLMQYCINFAKKELQLKNLILYSNTKLENAIYIYKKYGFTEIPVEENCPYERCNIKMELPLN